MSTIEQLTTAPVSIKASIALFISQMAEKSASVAKADFDLYRWVMVEFDSLAEKHGEFMDFPTFRDTVLVDFGKGRNQWTEIRQAWRHCGSDKETFDTFGKKYQNYATKVMAALGIATETPEETQALKDASEFKEDDDGNVIEPKRYKTEKEVREKRKAILGRAVNPSGKEPLKDKCKRLEKELADANDPEKSEGIDVTPMFQSLQAENELLRKERDEVRQDYSDLMDNTCEALKLIGLESKRIKDAKKGVNVCGKVAEGLRKVMDILS